MVEDGVWRGREFVGLHHFGFWVDDVAATKKAKAVKDSGAKVD